MKAPASKGAIEKSILIIVTAMGLLAPGIGVPSALAGAAQLVSARHPAVPLPAGGNGDSVLSSISADGRFVLITSSANDLVPGQENRFKTDVYLRDRASNTTVLVSIKMGGTSGGNGNSAGSAVSSNGRYVLFQSDATDLIAGDTNGLSDLFVRDLVAGTTALVNVSTNGGFAIGTNSDEVMTPDGRFVAYVSTATNLVSGDTNNLPDVFVRDMLFGTTTLVSVGAAQFIVYSDAAPYMQSPAITPDGRFVAFATSFSGLVPGVSNIVGEVYVRDLVSSTTTWASTNAKSVSGAGAVPCTHPVISDDGIYVSYKMGRLYNGFAGTVSGLRYNGITGTNARVSLSFIPTQVFGDEIAGPEMTPDGRFLAYAYLNSFTDLSFSTIRLLDAQSNLDTLVNQNIFGGFPSNSYADTPRISADGRIVAYFSTATNLVTNTVAPGTHLYLTDIQLGTNQLVDVGTNGVGSTDLTGTSFAMSSDGRYIVFYAPDGSLVAGDSNHALDVFLRDTVAGTTDLISARNPGIVPQSGNGTTLHSPISMTPDGHWMAFTSVADDLVPNDSNGDIDVFVRDLVAGTNVLVSVGANGLAASGGYSVNPLISADGRYVVFVSAATNIIVGDATSANSAADIFRRDFLLGTTSRLNVDPGSGVLGGGDSSAPSISQDANRIAFLRKTNVSTPSQTYWCDVNSNLTVVLSSSSALPPSVSGDGRFVAYSDSASNLFIWDANSGTNIYTNQTPMSSYAISPGGGKMLYHISGASNRLYVADISTGSNLTTFDTRVPIRSQGQWSADGRYFAFVSAFVLTSGDTNATNDVFLCDTLTGTLTLVSTKSNGVSSANGASDVPVVSGNGRFVVYRSMATDIVPGTSDAPNLFAFDRLTGSNTIVTTGFSVPGWSSWVFRPSVSAGGTMVGFASYKPAGTLDLNRVSDIFAAPQSPWPTTDSDGDGIPDAWTQQYFGHPLGQAGDLSRAQDDADGDGLSNLQEYMTGTSPTSFASALRVTISATLSNNTVVLNWPSAPGKNFKVQYKNSLNDSAWLDLAGSASVVGNQASFTTPIPVPSRYYRVTGVD